MNRKIQDLFKEKRDCDTLIQQGSEAKRRKLEINKELEKLCIDLVKSKKIKWTNISFEDWFSNDGEDEFWVYQSDTGDSFGVWKGLNELNSIEREHFDDYVNDYFYYNGPNYIDTTDKNTELSECQLAFEGDCKITSYIKH